MVCEHAGPSGSFIMRHFLHLYDLSDVDIERMLRAAQGMKRQRIFDPVAQGHALALLFFNASLRTRTSMEVAAYELGAYASVLNVGQGIWPLEWRDSVIMDGVAAEHVRDAIPVLGRYFQAIGVRSFPEFRDYEADRSDAIIHRVAELSSVPVVNLESSFDHPCQALGDLLTLRERIVGPRGKKFVLTWAYHPRPLPMSVPNAVLIAAAWSGMDVVLARPEGFELDESIIEKAQQLCKRTGARFEETDNQAEAFEGASVIYAKAWASRLIYEDIDEEAKLREAYRTWRVTQALMERTNNAYFMHCLPVRRGVVVEDAVLDGPRSLHIEQAENRLHAQKAILKWIWKLL